MPRLRSSVSAVLGAGQNFADRCRKFIEPGARNNDRVPTSVRFFSDAQKLSAIVLSELDVEALAFDLKLSCFYNTIHFLEHGESSVLL